MRVYLPSTLPALRAAAAAGGWAGPLLGYAVTPRLRESYLGDAEELEYLAQRLAARESLRLLAVAADAPRRRAVLALELDDLELAGLELADLDAEDPGAVRLSARLDWARVAAGLLDDHAAEAVVAAAAGAIFDADGGDADAQWLVDECDGVELAWFATQELARL